MKVLLEFSNVLEIRETNTEIEITVPEEVFRFPKYRVEIKGTMIERLT